jgi:hypothetical protein
MMLTHNILPRDKGFRQFYSFYKNFLTRRAEDGPEEKTKLVVGLCYIFFAEILTILTEMLLPHQFCVCALNKPTSLLLLYQQVRGEAPLLYIRGNHRRSHVKRKK